MNKKLIKILLSSFLLILSYGFIAYKIIHFKELKEIPTILESFKKNDLLIIISILILLFLNLSIETLKWKLLIDEIQHLVFWDSFKAVLSGITLGIFTPNRIGDIGGRVFHLEKGKRTFGVFAGATGSFAQTIAIICMGLAGFVGFLLFFPDQINFSPFLNYLALPFLIVLIILLLWMYFNVKRIKSLLLKFRFFQTRNEQVEYFTNIDNNKLIKVILFSFLRYIVFSSQFYLFLILFKVDVNALQAYISISLVYLFLTIFPTTMLIELGIRGSLSIFFIGIFSNQVLEIILSSIFLWFINLAFPALIGSIFFIRKNFV